MAWETRRPPAASEARRAVVLRLVPPAAAPRERAARVEARQPVLSSPGLRLILPPDLAAPSTGDGPPPAGEVGAPGTAAVGAALSPGSAASGAGALNLRPRIEILRGALANPATTDPRSNSPRPTFEERIAMGLDPDLCVKLERDADGVVRRRMGRMARTLTHLQSTQGVGAKDVRTCE